MVAWHCNKIWHSVCWPCMQFLKRIQTFAEFVWKWIVSTGLQVMVSTAGTFHSHRTPRARRSNAGHWLRRRGVSNVPGSKQSENKVGEKKKGRTGTRVWGSLSRSTSQIVSWACRADLPAHRRLVLGVPAQGSAVSLADSAALRVECCPHQPWGRPQTIAALASHSATANWFE